MHAPMRRLRISIALLCVLGIGVAGGRTHAGDAAAAAGFEGADASALREMLEGAPGRRAFWKTAPALIVLSPVLDYTNGDVLRGYQASDESLSDTDLNLIALELTEAIQELTDGAFDSFRSISVETVAPGTTVKVFRPGAIVVARYHRLRSKTGNIGYGGRSTRNDTINGAVMMLDADFDRESQHRFVLRTHELGHALGYHHVESRPSVMNPRMSSGITEFDRNAIRFASRPLHAEMKFAQALNFF